MTSELVRVLTGTCQVGGGAGARRVLQEVTGRAVEASGIVGVEPPGASRALGGGQVIVLPKLTGFW